jgi:hypothetical protein
MPSRKDTQQVMAQTKTKTVFYKTKGSWKTLQKN